MFCFYSGISGFRHCQGAEDTSNAPRFQGCFENVPFSIFFGHCPISLKTGENNAFSLNQYGSHSHRPGEPFWSHTSPGNIAITGCNAPGTGCETRTRMVFSKCPAAAQRGHRIRNGISPTIPAPQSYPALVTRIRSAVLGWLTPPNPVWPSRRGNQSDE
jgi:hypothetical protein